MRSQFRKYEKMIGLLRLVMWASVGLMAHAFAAQPTKSSIVTGANGYVGRSIVNDLVELDDAQIIYCLVRENRVEVETEYWRGKSESIRVLPYDMLDGGKSIKEALVVACEMPGGEPCADICVYHVASVFGPSDDHVQTAEENVKGVEDLVKSLEGVPNCKLVVTSSMAAVRGSGQEPLNGKYYTHEDWNTVSRKGDNWGSSYQWSKAESEKRAWEIAKDLGIPMISVCPSFVFGPLLGGIETSSFSIILVKQWALGESTVQSRLCVDVRDVAKAHVAAGTKKSALGKRFIVSREERIPSNDMANALKEVCRETGLGNADAISHDSEFQGGAIPIGNKEVEATSRLYEELGVTLRPVPETMADMARVLLRE